MTISDDMTLQHGKPSTLSQKAIDQLLGHQVLARIATCNDSGEPHVVPVWFDWDGKSMWIESSPSARKARNLYKNRQCMVSVDGTQGGLRFWAILLKGEAELITQPIEYVREVVIRIYTKYVGEEGILAPQPQGMISANHVLLKLTPTKIITWNATHSPIPIFG